MVVCRICQELENTISQKQKDNGKENDRVKEHSNDRMQEQEKIWITVQKENWTQVQDGASTGWTYGHSTIRMDGQKDY